MKLEIPDFRIYTMRERQERSERELTEADGVMEEKRTDPDPVEEQEERSGDYEGEVEEDIGGGRGEREHLEKMREEWERGRVEMETGKPYKYPPEYFYLKVREQSIYIDSIYHFNHKSVVCQKRIDWC